MSEPDVAVPARALGDPARSRMATALLGDVELAAGALARVAGVSASTASQHLEVLRGAGLVVVEQRGRQRCYRLAGADVARAIEALQAIAPQTEVRSLRQHRASRDLREGRTCYDHLAGDLGLRASDLLLRHGVVAAMEPGDAVDAPHPFPAGAVVDALGVRPPAGPRPWARGCLDWTGRRPHVAGQVGAQVLDALRRRGWVEARGEGRAVRLTEAGETGLTSLEGLAAASAG